MKIASIPENEQICDRFMVSLNGETAPVSAARVSAMIFNCVWPGHQRPLDQTEIAGFVRCESDEPVEVCVTVNEPVQEVWVRPLSKNVKVSQDGNELHFNLPGPGQYVLEVNDSHRALHLFVAPETELPPVGPEDLYFGPGEHNIGVMELHDNQTVILDAGAVVYGGFAAFGAENIRITGTGILDGSKEVRTNDTGLIPAFSSGWDDPEIRDYFLDNGKLRSFIRENQVLNGCIRLYNCRNCVIEHITLRDSSTFTVVPAGCENIRMDDIKLIGMWRYNSDGVDYFNSRNCVLSNSFLRDFDDCVVIKGIVGWGHRNNENLLTENCVVWCDWGRGLEVGAETNADEFCNIIFRNCDVIHGSWLHLDIQHHNDAYIHDILFDDIRCEYTRHQQPLKYQDSPEQTYEEAKVIYDHPGLLGAFFVNLGLLGAPHGTDRIHRICFRNIQVLSDEEVPMPTCGFEGLSEQNHIKDIVIENLTRNGKKITDPALANVKCNEFAWNVSLE